VREQFYNATFQDVESSGFQLSARLFTRLITRLGLLKLALNKTDHKAKAPSDGSEQGCSPGCGSQQVRKAVHKSRLFTELKLLFSPSWILHYSVGRQSERGFTVPVALLKPLFPPFRILQQPGRKASFTAPVALLKPLFPPCWILRRPGRKASWNLANLILS
jgi:hypothetical protein